MQQGNGPFPPEILRQTPILVDGSNDKKTRPAAVFLVSAMLEGGGASCLTSVWETGSLEDIVYFWSILVVAISFSEYHSFLR